MAHILIVDDDRATVRLLTMLLEMDGFEVSGTARPDDVLEKARTGAVDAFLIDCHLAGSDGLDLVREIRADADLASKPIIVSSGKYVKPEALEAGANLFVLKPFSPADLSAELSELLAERDAPSEERGESQAADASQEDES